MYLKHISMRNRVYVSFILQNLTCRKPDMHCYMMKYADKNWIGK